MYLECTKILTTRDVDCYECGVLKLFIVIPRVAYKGRTLFYEKKQDCIYGYISETFENFSSFIIRC